MRARILSFFYAKIFPDLMGRRRFEKMKDRRRQIAVERIETLLSLAEGSMLEGDAEHAGRYAHLARKIGMRYNVNMPRGFKFRFCRNCGTYLVPSRTSRVRLTGKRITSSCINCGTRYRMPIRKKEGGH